MVSKRRCVLITFQMTQSRFDTGFPPRRVALRYYTEQFSLLQVLQGNPLLANPSAPPKSNPGATGLAQRFVLSNLLLPRENQVLRRWGFALGGEGTQAAPEIRDLGE